MFVRIDENPNCEWIDGRVFNEIAPPQAVISVLRQIGEKEVWCDVIAVDDAWSITPAFARRVEDSGEGTCYLVYGGSWGLRLRPPECQDAWDVTDTHQWGEGFLLLPANGADLRFANGAG